jgi:hypothetical protein
MKFELNIRYLAYWVSAIIIILGWNAFLIKRDDALYKSYYKKQAIENVKKIDKSMLNN